MVVEGTGGDVQGGSEDGNRLGAIDGLTLLEAYCQAQLAALPQGRRGLRAAGELLTAIPAARRLGWSDITVSAPRLFRMLESAGLITSCPSDSDIPAALRLVGSVCELVTQRSARRWTVWFSRACDPDDPLGASIRKAVTPAMLHQPPSTTPNEPPRRTTSIRAERDQLASELGALREELKALQATHNHTDAELVRAREKAAEDERQLADLRAKRANSKQERTKATLALTESEAKAEGFRQDAERTLHKQKILEREKDNLKRELRGERAKQGERDRRIAALRSERDVLKDQYEEQQKKSAQLIEKNQGLLSDLARFGRNATKEVEAERRRIAELHAALSTLGGALGLGDFVEEEAWTFVKSAERKIRGITRENKQLQEEAARFFDISAIELAEAQYRLDMYANGWPSESIDAILKEPSEQKLIRKSARRSAKHTREIFAANTAIELPFQGRFWEE